MEFGTVLAIFGAAIAAILCGIGSAIGVQAGGKAATGVMSEKPELFGKVLVLEALPGTQGIYGFLIAIIVMVQLNMLGGTMTQLETQTGWAVFGACMPIAIVGLFSAIMQSRITASAIHMTAKQPDASGKGITLSAIVETYALLTFIVSLILVTSII